MSEIVDSNGIQYFSVKERDTGKEHKAMIGTDDWKKLGAAIRDLSTIHTIPVRKGTRLRSPYVSVLQIKDPKLRADCATRKLAAVLCSHLVLGIRPGTLRVRYIDGNPLNLIRSNLRTFGSEEPAPRKRRGVEVVPPAPVSPRLAPAEFSLTREPRAVWVVRAGKHEEVFLDKQAALNRFAELTLDKVR